MPQNPPAPNDPPSSYQIAAMKQYFFGESKAELESVKKSHRLEPELGGMERGKHLTTTPELARKWGQQRVNLGWEKEIGAVLEVRLSETIAEEIDFVGEIDGIGACYFARFDQLEGAKISEVKI